MYRTIQHQMSIDDYLPPYEGELVQENRWVRLAQAIDWDAIEQEYSGHFAAGGKVAIPARMAFGVLVIRAACRTTDSETVEIVRESPYLQYFLGFDSFTYDVPFSSRSHSVWFIWRGGRCVTPWQAISCSAYRVGSSAFCT